MGSDLRDERILFGTFTFSDFAATKYGVLWPLVFLLAGLLEEF